jgi:hypothetical protein
MNPKSKHEKAIRRRNKLKVRADAERQVASLPSIGGVNFSQGAVVDYIATQKGYQPVSLEEIPESIREEFRKEAERCFRDEGIRLKFYLRPDGQYCFMQ